MLSAYKRMAAGLAVGALLGSAAAERVDAVLPAAGDIGKGRADIQRGAHLTADAVTMLYQAADHHAQAELLLKRVIARDEKLHGPDYPGLVTSLNKLATLYWTTGRPAAA